MLIKVSSRFALGRSLARLRRPSRRQQKSRERAKRASLRGTELSEQGSEKALLLGAACNLLSLAAVFSKLIKSRVQRSFSRGHRQGRGGSRRASAQGQGPSGGRRAVGGGGSVSTTVWMCFFLLVLRGAGEGQRPGESAGSESPRLPLFPSFPVCSPFLKCCPFARHGKTWMLMLKSLVRGEAQASEQRAELRGEVFRGIQSSAERAPGFRDFPRLSHLQQSAGPG